MKLNEVLTKISGETYIKTNVDLSNSVCLFFLFTQHAEGTALDACVNTSAMILKMMRRHVEGYKCAYLILMGAPVHPATKDPTAPRVWKSVNI